MHDPNWDLINGPVAHEIEVLNYANQANVIEAIFKFIQFYNNNSFPNELALKELHRTGTLFLLNHPGQYRTEEVVVQHPDGTVVHTPPSHSEVDRLMKEFFLELEQMWSDSAPIRIAAFSLWKINWIHPFKNGNGRTARAFIYSCLCTKFGFLLPGNTTIIDLIMRDRDQYQTSLRIADRGFAESKIPTLTDMENFLERLLIEQLSSAGILGVV